MKFKVGDKVRVINQLCDEFLEVGVITTIIKIVSPAVPYPYVLSADINSHYGPHELELVESVNFECKTLERPEIKPPEGYVEAREKAVQDAKDGAMRFNSGKVEGHTLPLLAMAETFKAGMFGQAKYSSNNWRKPTKTTQYYDCNFRHITKYLYGQELDKDSQCHHLAHAAWNCLAELEKILTGTREDDRYVYENVDEIIEKVFNLSDGQKAAINRELKKKENKC